MRTRVLLIGKSGRLHALALALSRSATTDLFILSEVDNIGLRRTGTVEVGDSANPDTVAKYAEVVRPDFVVVGPEEPLEAGVVDRLREMGIPSVGPIRELAKIETSKSFTRNLFSKHNIPGNPEFRVFNSSAGLSEYLHQLGEFVIKPDGLTGGKGVKVFGDHFSSVEEGLAYCAEILATGSELIIEEKLDGEEFTFQSFCDGRTVVDMIPVQDHKRLKNGDKGPNTGGMGSYSCSNHLLPFLSTEDVAFASEINKLVAKALLDETGEEYKGILYGGFILTANGIKVIEYNARFGDPEAMNALSILETDFVEICRAIIDGTLDQIPVRFQEKATVCKYVVPEGYPTQPVKGEELILNDPPVSDINLHTFYAAVEDGSGRILMTGSRAIAFVGVGDTIEEAEQIAEAAAQKVAGRVFHRTDIGTSELIERRIAHMAQVRASARSPVLRRTG